MVNFKVKDINQLFKRRYKLMNIGLEFKTKDDKRMYIAFQSIEERDLFYNGLSELVPETCMTAE